MAQTQKPVAFVVELEEEKKDSEFAQNLQEIADALRPKILVNKAFGAVGTKAWKSQKTTIIVGRLDRKFDENETAIWKECPDFLSALDENHAMMANKPRSMVGVYSVLDDEKNAVQIDGKDVYFCVMKCSEGRGSVESLKAPSNIIQPTKNNDYQHNTETNEQNVDADELLIAKKMQ